MNTEDFKSIMIRSISNLDIVCLQELDSSIVYYHLTKSELIKEFSFVYKELSVQGVTHLNYKKNKCNHCYPNLESFDFFDKDRNFQFRYIIDYDEKYIVRLCSNCENNFDWNSHPF
jgi:hypothetical protein